MAKQKEDLTPKESFAKFCRNNPNGVETKQLTPEEMEKMRISFGEFMRLNQS